MKSSRFPVRLPGGILTVIFLLTFSFVPNSHGQDNPEVAEYVLIIPAIGPSVSNVQLNLNQEGDAIQPDDGTQAQVGFDQNGDGNISIDEFAPTNMENGSVTIPNPSIGSYIVQIPQGDDPDNAINIPLEVEAQVVEVPQVQIPGGNAREEIVVEVESEPSNAEELCEQQLQACDRYQDYCEAPNPDCVTLCDEDVPVPGCTEGVVCVAEEGDCIPMTDLCWDSPGALDCGPVHDFCSEVYERCRPSNEEPPPPPSITLPEDPVAQTVPGTMMGIQGGSAMCTLGAQGATALQSFLTLLLFFVPPFLSSVLERHRRG